jgi:dsDNA-specific endonuclease/ATPase MutS2
VGFTETAAELRLRTPFGKKRAAAPRVFMPGEEASLEAEFDKLQKVCELLASRADAAKRIADIFDGIKDISHSLTRCADNTLSSVELFEVKALLLRTESFAGICGELGADLPAGFAPEDTGGLLDRLDPEGGRISAFYIYDLFSETLAALRRQKKEKETLLRAEQKRLADEIFAATGTALGPKFEAVIARSDAAALEAARNAPQLRAAGEDLSSVRFALALGEEALALRGEADALLPAIEEEEERVRKELTKAVAAEAERILRNCGRIGALDFFMARAAHALRHDCVRPAISRAHVLRAEDGRHLPTERALREKGRAYRPVSLELKDGVSCITGANMGGKTVSMKLAGLVAAMAQHGFFVPCKSAVVGLSSSVGVLIGDGQDANKGLSSFGSEMEALNAILTGSGERALILIDEIAGATNPAEGRALTKGLIAYLSRRPRITLITTHFDHVADIAGGAEVVNYRVRGLSGADLGELATALKDASSDERIDAIAKLMDYRLVRVSGEHEIPKDALRIAEILGISKEILDLAKRFMEEAPPERRRTEDRADLGCIAAMSRDGG